MIYTTYYKSPIGKILLASKDNKLIGLWIENQKYYLDKIDSEIYEKDDEQILVKTKKWLDRYFDGEIVEINELELDLIGSNFRKLVWQVLCDIPYGSVTTYKNIADIVSRKLNRKSMSYQAIGGAVAHNPISIIIPCHRVVGVSGNLTGYAGGIDKKIKLLEIENVNIEKLFVSNIK